MQLSNQFTLSDLTTTGTGYDNSPPTSVIPNLRSLAQLLEQIRSQIGPFQINSGYRSSWVNNAVGGVLSSLHLTGQAADLQPTTMSAKEFYNRIARSPLRQKIGELIDESEKGVVHVSTPTPTLRGVLKYMQDGKYYRYTEEQVKSLFGVAKNNPITTIVILSFIAGGAAYYFSRRKK